MEIQLLINIVITGICLFVLGMYFNSRERKITRVADKKFEDDGNYIEILHENDEISEYEHLRQHSAKVNVGDQVKKGETLLIIEAMKMENLILSPRDAVVKSINVAVNERVESSTALVEFEDLKI